MRTFFSSIAWLLICLTLPALGQNQVTPLTPGMLPQNLPQTTAPAVPDAGLQPGTAPQMPAGIPQGAAFSQVGQTFNGGYTPALASASRFPTQRVRIKDITTIEGHRSNHLSGTGLVTGLKGTGGTSDATKDSLRNLFLRNGQAIVEAPTGSASTVWIQVDIPAFARPGQKFRGSVSVLDNASSLTGGSLVAAPLKGYDGRVYAIASGKLIVDGFSAGGAGASVAKNHDTTATVEVQLEEVIDQSPAFPDSTFRLLLTNKDYATAYRIADAINERFPNHARARDSGSVDVMFPYQYQRRKMDFVVGIQDLRIIPDVPARVVVNQNTGTIVVGHNVKLTHVAFANENLVVTTAESPIASQPAPLSNGQTAILERTQVTATQTGGTYNVLNEQPTVADLATMLNQMGIPPRDFINILRQIEAAGHLQAELIVR